MKHKPDPAQPARITREGDNDGMGITLWSPCVCREPACWYELSASVTNHYTARGIAAAG